MTQVYKVPIARVFTSTGLVAVGYQKFFYETGTTTKKSIFSDSALTTPLTNPVLSDADGYFVQIFMEGTGDEYKAVLATDTDTDPPTSPIWTADPIEVDANDINAFGTRPAQHWGTTTNTAAAYQISPITALSSYTDDLLFSAQIHTDSTGAGTLAVEDLNDLGNFLAALDIKKYDGAGGKVDIEAGDLLGNQTYIFRIDSTDVVVLNPEIREVVKVNTLVIPDNGELIIASGVITITASQHTLDTESDASTDDLDTINGGTSEQVLILSIEDDSRDVVIKHGTGNIITDTQADITLGLANDIIVLKFNGTDWLIVSRSINSDYSYMVVRDQKSSGTDAGTPSTGTRNTRTLNTVAINTISGASLSSNQITLPAGTYYIDAKAPAAAVNGHKLFFRNDSDSTDAIVGTSGHIVTADLNNGWSFAQGIVTIASSKTFQLEHYIQSNGGGTGGLGENTGSGDVEVYSTVYINKLR